MDKVLGNADERADDGGDDNVPEVSTENWDPEGPLELVSDTRSLYGVQLGCSAWQSIRR